MEKIILNDAQLSNLVKVLKLSLVPPEQESITHSFVNTGNSVLLANSYFAIIAICHQTSPLGERRLEGHINNTKKGGWDYLKEKFLLRALEDEKWASPDYWMILKPTELSELYEDHLFGKTLNRVNERAFLLNNLGHRLKDSGFENIEAAFSNYCGIVGGDTGFLAFLKTFEAYKDPVMKKAQFFLAIMTNELGWVVQDRDSLLSPVDYHEMRGHLRIGTITLQDRLLASKVQQGLPLSDEEDIEIRRKIQDANDLIGRQTGLGSSAVHYLFWNVFRNCCPRESNKTHCSGCDEACGLPAQYKSMNTYENRCLFSGFCLSANKGYKVIDPPYIGHHY